MKFSEPKKNKQKDDEYVLIRDRNAVLEPGICVSCFHYLLHQKYLSAEAVSRQSWMISKE